MRSWRFDDYRGNPLTLLIVSRRCVRRVGTGIVELYVVHCDVSEVDSCLRRSVSATGRIDVRIHDGPANEHSDYQTNEETAHTYKIIKELLKIPRQSSYRKLI